MYARDCAAEFEAAWDARAEKTPGMPRWDDVPAEAKTGILVEVGLTHFEAEMAEARERFTGRIAPAIEDWAQGARIGLKPSDPFPLSRYGRRR